MSVDAALSSAISPVDAALTKMPSILDTAALKRVNANAMTLTRKRGGKDVAAGKVVVSKNGKPTTETATSMSAEGQKTHNVMVYDKQ